MEMKAAVDCFAALAHPHRLAIFRLLMRIGPDGQSAGEIARNLGMAPSSLSFHTQWLVRAGLIGSWRDGRQVFYAVDVEGTRAMIRFLGEDCCAGHPDLCGFAELMNSAGIETNAEECNERSEVR